MIDKESSRFFFDWKVCEPNINRYFNFDPKEMQCFMGILFKKKIFFILNNIKIIIKNVNIGNIFLFAISLFLGLEINWNLKKN